MAYRARMTGPRTMVGLGIEIHLIQLMARWSSDVVYRYVAEAPLSRMTAAYRRGYASQAALEACPSCPSQVVHKESEEPSPNIGEGPMRSGPSVKH